MKIVFSAVLMACVAFPAFGDDYRDAYGNDSGSSNYGDSEYKYESTTGTRYKYDLSDPVDKVMYEVDPAAKVMDDINPNVSIDRTLNQYGGGAKW